MTGAMTMKVLTAASSTAGSRRACRISQAPYSSGVYIFSAAVPSGPNSPEKADSVMP